MRKFTAIVLALSTALLSSPVSAGWQDESGPGSSGDPGSSRWASIRCNVLAGEGWNYSALVPAPAYSWPWGGCVNPNLSSSAFTAKSGEGTPYVLCTTGWEVWRFYGTLEYPVQLMTVSRINANTTTGFEGGCMDNKKVGIFSPDSADVAEGALPIVPQVGADRLGRASYGITATGETIFTPAPPFRWLKANVSSCTDLMRSPAEVAETIAAKRADVDEHYTNQKALFGEAVALAEVNGWVGDDGVPCNSGLEFNGDQGQQTRIYGACAIPIQTRMIRTYDWRESTYSPDRVYNSATWLGGERYDNKKYPNGGGTLDTLFPTQAPTVRSTIYQEVLDRQGSILRARPWYTDPSVPTAGGVQVVLPGEPYLPDWRTNPKGTRNAVEAATAATLNARCEVGKATGIVAPATPATQQIVPGGSVNVTVEAPARFFAGGVNRPQTVSMTPGQFMCTDCVLPPVSWDNRPGPVPVLQSLSVSANVSSTGGFEAWREVSRSPDMMLSKRNVTLEFFGATAGTGQNMVVDVSASGTYQVTSGRTRVNVGSPSSPVWVVYYTLETRPLTVTVSQPQVVRPVVGATAVGG
jgi:hypothetical protein